MASRRWIDLVAAVAVAVAAPTAAAAEDKPVCEARKLSFGDAPAKGTVRVMTYNIRLGASGDKADDAKADAADTTFFAPDPHAKARADEICSHLRQLAEVIAASNPDLVAFQEIDDKFSDRSAKLDEPRELAAMLGMHAKFSPRKTGYGIALLWREKLESKVDGTLELADGKLDGDQAKQVVAYVDFPGLGIRVAATHLSGSSAELRKAAAESIKAEKALAGPTVVLLGDMNTGPDSPDYPHLLAGRHDALPDLKITEATVASPKKQYDHVFLGSSVTAIDAHVIPTRTLTLHAQPHSHSDHSAVVVDLRVKS
jgi:endonuclease/exonuclease/phosphatase family metal-dependent hydrolase